MIQNSPVPRLDLAPKLDRPLSMWNPLDYLRLLYWVFYFPQALRWYVEEFGGGEIPKKKRTWGKVPELLRQYPIQRHLLLQALFLAVFTTLLISLILQKIGVLLDWSLVREIVKLVVFCRGGIFIGLVILVMLMLSLSERERKEVAQTVAPDVAEMVVITVAGVIAGFTVFCVKWDLLGGVEALFVELGVPLDVELGGVAVQPVQILVFCVKLGMVFGLMRNVNVDMGLHVGGVVKMGVMRVVSCVTSQLLLGISLGRLLGIFLLGICFLVILVRLDQVLARGLILNVNVAMKFLLFVTIPVKFLLFVMKFLLFVTIPVRVLVTLSLAFYMGGFSILLRLDNWLISLPFNLRTIPNNGFFIPRITPIPIPYLDSRLEKWLQQDWKTGLDNANQLLRYTLQSNSVLKAINNVLAETQDDQVIWYVSKLAESPVDWDLVRFTSASLDADLKSYIIDDLSNLSDNLPYLSDNLTYLSQSWREELQALFLTNPRINTPARAASAGFWYLHEKKPTKAMEAFAVVRSLLYGEEMYILAQTLKEFYYIDPDSIDSISDIKLPVFPQDSLLRPDTWETLNSLGEVVEDVRSAKYKEALQKLANILILSTVEKLPQAEQGLIIDIAQRWQEIILRVADKFKEG